MGTKTINYLKFEEAMLPYANFWDEWVLSDFCVLSDKEVSAASIYITSQSIQKVAAHLNRSLQTANVYINRVRRKLIFGLTIFLEWKTTRKIDDLYPLNIPIPCLKAPLRLKRCLTFVGDSLAEVLHDFSIEELQKMRGFGSGTLSELINLLDKYGFAKLLRSSKAEPLPEILMGYKPKPINVESEKAKTLKIVWKNDAGGIIHHFKHAEDVPRRHLLHFSAN